MHSQAFSFDKINSRKKDDRDLALLVADHVNAMLAYWDKDLVCRFANDAYREWFGKSKEEMIDKITLPELLGPLYAKNLPYINGALAGKKQVFEREIPLPGDGGFRYSLATYFPDIFNNEVMGFFVLVADVSYIKELERKLLLAKREMLRSVMEAQEKERIVIAEKLRDSVNQTLAYCKIVIEQYIAKAGEDDYHIELRDNIRQAIGELNFLSTQLDPSGLYHFGFSDGMEMYLDEFKMNFNGQVFFDADFEKLEKLTLQDKFSVFRIIQNFLHLFAEHSSARIIRIMIDFDSNVLKLSVSQNDKSYFPETIQKEFREIEHRIEYYSGRLELMETPEENLFVVALPVALNNI